MAAKIYKFPSKIPKKFMMRNDICWKDTGTGGHPVFVKVDGWWVTFDPTNQDHASKITEAEIIKLPLTGNKN
jgi:hypothetical protein